MAAEGIVQVMWQCAPGSLARSEWSTMITPSAVRKPAEGTQVDLLGVHCKYEIEELADSSFVNERMSIANE
jgi:hypothetical protein